MKTKGSTLTFCSALPSEVDKWQHLRFFRPLWGRSEDVKFLFLGGGSSTFLHPFLTGFRLKLYQAALVQGLGRTMMQLIPQHFWRANGFIPLRKGEAHFQRHMEMGIIKSLLLGEGHTRWIYTIPSESVYQNYSYRSISHTMCAISVCNPSNWFLVLFRNLRIKNPRGLSCTLR